MLELNDQNFKQEVEDFKGVIMIDFWAPWCGPCQVSGPIVEEVSENIKEKAKIAKLNVDENNEIASKFGVMSIPTFIFIKDGKEIERKIGMQSKEEMIRKIEELLGE